MIASSTVNMLEDLGHIVIEANSAKRALEILDNGQTVDLLITDQAMPGMTGIELAVPCAPVRKSLLEEYRIFTGSSSDKNTLRILPALNISKTELDNFVTAFGEVMAHHIKEKELQPA